MSKRKRRIREDRPADEKAKQANLTGTVLDQPEPEIVVSGPAFDEFENILDAQLEALVNRWSHVAAPSASAIRRAVSQGTRRTSEQA